MSKRRSKSAKPASDSDKAKPAPSFPVVGIGASAGGLEAATELLEHLPAETGLAFALVQHLDPKHPSQLSDILQRATKMRVTEARDGMQVAANCVYIIPPNTQMRIADAVLHLTPRPEPREGVNLPIDEFFRSLAMECDGTSIGVVLSGNASDGTEGLKAIKASGGLTFAQDEKSARYAGMPRSAVRSGCVDFVLPPAKIAEEIARLGKHPFVVKPKAEAEQAAAEAAEQVGDGLKKIFTLLRSASGVDFGHYKQSTINRRLQRRMAVHHIEDLDEYAAHLETHPEEVEAACNDALIHVTQFFREPESFDALAKKVFPALLEKRAESEPIRVWLPGCSTGEEAYSLAIRLVEFIGDRADAPGWQVFGTDVSERVIEQARKGLYSANIEADVSPERLRRFFTRVESGWQISKTIRDHCVFARQNVLKDPPFSKIDLVSCRNVLIYFERPAQEKLIPIFHYSLKRGGWLLLGSAESVGAFSGKFETVDAKHKIFARRPGESSAIDMIHEFPAARTTAPGEPAGEKEIWSRLDVQKEADRVLMARYCPPSIVVGENLEIIQFRGSVAPFLEPATGDASLNLFRMTRPAIEVELRAAINHAKKTGAPVRKENVRLHSGGAPRFVNLDVVPLGSAALRERCFVVLFEDRPPEPEPAATQSARGRAKGGEKRVTQLESDVAAGREHLQSVLEEHDATTEELRSANEEIQSSNEELQSTNEELETAKEELQSANEELTTVNEELKHANLNLGDLNNDLGNLLRSVSIPIVMLDRELRIRRFTPVAEKMWKLAPGDVGRAIGDLRLEFELPGLDKMLRAVLDSLESRETDVQTHDGRWWRLQARPYETVDNQITGVVLILFDIDAARREAERRELATAYAEAFVGTVREAFLVLDGELRVKWATTAFYRAFRVSARQTEGQLLYELGNGQWDIPQLRKLLEKILPKETQVQDFEVQHTFPQIGKKRMLLNARRIERDVQGEPLILLAIEEQPG